MSNETEFIEIIKAHEALIYKIARLYANTRDGRQDLYQDIVYQLWKSFSSFRGESKISTWMYRIALNTSIGYLNKEKRTTGHQPIDETLLNRTDPADTLKEEQIEALYANIKTLGTMDTAIIFLYLEAKTYEEMAEITGLSATNIGTRLGRIRQKIIDQIKV
jgi:RNA polymerase sigma factor (sigma-70 family)